MTVGIDDIRPWGKPHLEPEDRFRTYLTKDNAILQHHTQLNATLWKNGENPVMARVFNHTQLHENMLKFLAFT